MVLEGARDHFVLRVAVAPDVPGRRERQQPRVVACAQMQSRGCRSGLRGGSRSRWRENRRAVWGRAIGPGWARP